MSIMQNTLISTNDALAVFANAFARNRSIASPAEAASIGPLYVVRDVPGTRRIPRGQEIIVPAATQVDEAIDQITEYQPSGGFMVCILREHAHENRPTIDEMKQRGYRFLRSEPLMVRPTAINPSDQKRPSPKDIQIGRVNTHADAAEVAKLAGGRQLTDEDLVSETPGISVHYARTTSGEMVSFARSAVACGHSYLAGMFTAEPHRRRGIATAVLRATLDHDLGRGAEYNVLLASRAGEQLYLTMGYSTIGTLNVFKLPSKR